MPLSRPAICTRHYCHFVRHRLVMYRRKKYNYSDRDLRIRRKKSKKRSAGMVICPLGSICRHGHPANLNLPACRRSCTHVIVFFQSGDLTVILFSHPPYWLCFDFTELFFPYFVCEFFLLEFQKPQSGYYIPSRALQNKCPRLYFLFR